ncbi:pif1, partial [Symbiodinium pilosum]
DLLEPFEGHPPSKLMAYVTPQMCNWLPIMESATVTDTVLQHVEVAALQVLDIYVDYRTRRGGKAEVVSKQKTSVVRAEWRAESLLTLRKDESQKAIFDWLMHNNTTYRQFVEMHDELCKAQPASDKDWRRIPTATLLLQLSGIEVAFRPWLYPLASFGDSDISNRLVSLGRISVKSKPSLRASFMRKDMTKALPSVFFTVAPAEWTFPLHDGMFFEDSLSNQQSIMTLHMYHALQSMLEKHFLAEGTHLARVGLAKIRQWSLRFEFQSRGTVHVHCVLWADFCPGTDIEKLCGRTDTKHDSEFVRVLENLFKCRVDVQCGDGNYVLMRYVAGYLSKASDALKFRATEATSNLSTWRQVYRLLCKKSPLEQELIMEFAGLPMVMHSFTGCHLFAPVPGSSAQNTSRDFYAAYQQLLQAGEDSSQSREARSLSFMQWLRRYNVQLVGQRGPDATYKITERAQRGRHSGKDCGIAMKFAFELLDIYIASWAAVFMPGMDERRVSPMMTEDYPSGMAVEHARRASFQAPEGCQYLKAVLCLNEFQVDPSDPRFQPDVTRLLQALDKELAFRGLSKDRVATCKARISASAILLLAVRDGRADPNLWRPIGLLVSMYRQRLLAGDQLTLETLHSSFKVTREADAQYIPPGRLRAYDLIILDEISQIDSHAWGQIKLALAELHPRPFVVLVGDFQQLQPIHGFVNGNVGTVRTVLRPDVFIFETIQNQLLLGATMDAVGLHLDKKVPDRGYAYVGASRVKSHEDIFLLGSIRTTDWLPVGGPGSPEEHIKPGPLSDTSSSADEAEPSSSDDSQPGTSDFENGFESLFDTP